MDIIAIFNGEDDYTKTRNYWKYLKTKLKSSNPQLVSDTNQLKLKAPDGKMRLTDVLDATTPTITNKTINTYGYEYRQRNQEWVLGGTRPLHSTESTYGWV